MTRMRRMSGRVGGALPLISCAILLSGSPASAADEIYACQILRTCDSAGQCNAAKGAVTFELKALKVNRSGEGDYALRYGKKSYDAWSATDIGPVLWTEGRSDMQVLTMTSSEHVMWQRANIAKEQSEILFLKCET